MEERWVFRVALVRAPVALRIECRAGNSRKFDREVAHIIEFLLTSQMNGTCPILGKTLVSERILEWRDFQRQMASEFPEFTFAFYKFSEDGNFISITTWCGKVIDESDFRVRHEPGASAKNDPYIVDATYKIPLRFDPHTPVAGDLSHLGSGQTIKYVDFDGPDYRLRKFRFSGSECSYKAHVLVPRGWSGPMFYDPGEQRAGRSTLVFECREEGAIVD